MPNLTTKVPNGINHIIMQLQVLYAGKKGPAIRYLVHMARLKPNYPEAAFPGPDAHPANYGLPDVEYALFADFQLAYDPVLTRREPTFRQLLWCGASLYMDGYRLSNQADPIKSVLVPPKTPTAPAASVPDDAP